MIGAVLTAIVALAQAAPDATPPAVPAAPAAAPAAAAAPSAGKSVSPVTITGKKDPNLAAHEVVCRKEPVLGSLFPQEICATRQARAERTREDEADLRKWTSLRPYHSN
jgi:hypothetical protein